MVRSIFQVLIHPCTKHLTACKVVQVYQVSLCFYLSKSGKCGCVVLFLGVVLVRNKHRRWCRVHGRIVNAERGGNWNGRWLYVHSWQSFSMQFVSFLLLFVLQAEVWDLDIIRANHNSWPVEVTSIKEGFIVVKGHSTVRVLLLSLVSVSRYRAEPSVTYV